MERLEIKLPVVDVSQNEIKTGQFCYVEKKVLHVYIFGKFRKWRWFYRLFIKMPIEVGMVKGVDTSMFKKGDRLYLDPNNAGSLMLL